MNFRHEYKHSINYADYISSSSRLRAVLKPDLYASEKGMYEVRTLYFDNTDDKVLREKLNGESRREKFRIRYYNNSPHFIQLEKKSRIYGLCIKHRTDISREQCESLLAGKWGFLNDSGDPLFLELYGKMIYLQLRPKMIVDYTREAYVFPAGNVRVTLDGNIRTSLNSTDFFNPDLPMISTGDRILEVKYDSFIPQAVTDVIQICRCTSSFSKYAACRLI